MPGYTATPFGFPKIVEDIVSIPPPTLSWMVLFFFFSCMTNVPNEFAIPKVENDSPKYVQEFLAQFEAYGQVVTLMIQLQRIRRSNTPTDSSWIEDGQKLEEIKKELMQIVAVSVLNPTLAKEEILKWLSFFLDQFEIIDKAKHHHMRARSGEYWFLRDTLEMVIQNVRSQTVEAIGGKEFTCPSQEYSHIEIEKMGRAIGWTTAGESRTKLEETIFSRIPKIGEWIRRAYVVEDLNEKEPFWRCPISECRENVYEAGRPIVNGQPGPASIMVCSGCGRNHRHR